MDTSSKQVTMQTLVLVDGKLAGRDQTQQLRHYRKLWIQTGRGRNQRTQVYTTLRDAGLIRSP